VYQIVRNLFLRVSSLPREGGIATDEIQSRRVSPDQSGIFVLERTSSQEETEAHFIGGKRSKNLRERIHAGSVALQSDSCGSSRVSGLERIPMVSSHRHQKKRTAKKKKKKKIQKREARSEKRCVFQFFLERLCNL